MGHHQLGHTYSMSKLTETNQVKVIHRTINQRMWTVAPLEKTATHRDKLIVSISSAYHW